MDGRANISGRTQLRAWAVALAGCVFAFLFVVSLVASARWEAQADYEKGNEEREMSSGRASVGGRAHASITGAASVGAASVGTSANGRAPGAPAGRPAHNTSHAHVHEPSQERGHSMIRLEPGLWSQSSPEEASSPDDSMTLTSEDIRDIHHLARLKEEVSLNSVGASAASMADSDAGQNHHHPILGVHELAHELTHELSSTRVGASAAGKEMLSLVHDIPKCLYIVTLFGKYTGTLTFGNFCRSTCFWRIIVIT